MMILADPKNRGNTNNKKLSGARERLTVMRRVMTVDPHVAKI
jgi:hypothetical protein